MSRSELFWALGLLREKLQALGLTEEAKELRRLHRQTVWGSYTSDEQVTTDLAAFETYFKKCEKTVQGLGPIPNNPIPDWM